LIASGKWSFTPALSAPHLIAHPLAPLRPKVSRSRIWELGGSLHCSIIGTCLSTAELRKVLAKVGLATADETEHHLHQIGVSLASKRDAAAKMLNKTLDERHRSAIKRYSRATTETELRSF
jgi:hypothetical protein